ncbi:MAG: hypothetical protein J1F16_10420, partial [Muribaculaceae bacterium]|nr:hypothetical protein [Muribaculaceae bacterium]
EGKQTDFSVFIPKDIIETTPISKEIQKQKWLEIIENLQSRRLENDKKMTEIGNKLMRMEVLRRKNRYRFERNFTFLKMNRPLF